MHIVKVTASNSSKVFFQLVCPKNGCARPLGNSDIWNFFDGIYYVIWHFLRAYQLKNTLYNIHKH